MGTFQNNYLLKCKIYYEKNMVLTISGEVLKKQDLTLKEFGILLYYAGGGTGDIAPKISDKLWNMNLLTKTIDGYEYNRHANKRIEEWSEDSKKDSKTIADDNARFIALADKLRELFPEGKKDGTIYPWRDNTITIAKKLKTLCDKFQCKFTDEEAVAATKRYVDSFNGNYRYMQLLKYFILKRDNEKMEESSQLLNFIQNQEATNPTSIFRDNGEIL